MFFPLRLTMQGFLLPLGIALNKVSALLWSSLLERSLKSSSALTLALAVAPHVFSHIEDLTVSNLGRNVRSVSELAVLELFSEQGEGLLARNTEYFLSKWVIFDIQNYLQTLKSLSEYSRSFCNLSLLFIMVLLTFSVVHSSLWDLYQNWENLDFHQVPKLDNQTKLILKWLWMGKFKSLF